MDTMLDYAGQDVRVPRRFWADPRTWKITTAVLLVVVIVAGTLLYVYRYHVNSASLTSLGGNQKTYSDGREMQIMIAGNENRRTAVVLVLDAKRRVIGPGRSFLSSDPIEGLQSSYRLITTYPPDPKASGVWVDGRRREVSDRMLVVYISDKLPATDITIGEADQALFVDDARTLDPVQFVEKWIKPRLPKTK